MTREQLQKANEIKEKINYLENFIYEVAHNSDVKLFDRFFKKEDKKKSISVVISDYMRPYHYFELNERQRKKLIAILQEELEEYNKQLEEL